MYKLDKLSKLFDREIRRKNLVALKYELRGYWWDLTRPGMPDPVFVVGCSRAGTTITYETLAAAPQFLSFGWEIPQFWNSLYGPLNNGWESEAATAENAKPQHRDAAFRLFYQRLGFGQVLDKTCINVMRITYLHRLFPKARFVFIQRDGRDNISSMMDGWRHGRSDGSFHLSQLPGKETAPSIPSSLARFRRGWRSIEVNSASGIFFFPRVGAITTMPPWKRFVPING